jgi:hypothetical protein
MTTNWHTTALLKDVSGFTLTQSIIGTAALVRTDTNN